MQEITVSVVVNVVIVNVVIVNVVIVNVVVANVVVNVVAVVVAAARGECAQESVTVNVARGEPVTTKCKCVEFVHLVSPECVRLLVGLSQLTSYHHQIHCTSVY